MIGVYGVVGECILIGFRVRSGHILMYVCMYVNFP